MTPYEIMLSESQERMLIIVQSGREEEVKRIFDKWDLPWALIGRVTETGRMVVKHNNAVVPTSRPKLADEAPVYEPEAREPAHLKAAREFVLDSVPAAADPAADLKRLLAWPGIASRMGLSPVTTTPCGTARWWVRFGRPPSSASRRIAAAGSAAVLPRKIYRADGGLQRGYVYLDP